MKEKINNTFKIQKNIGSYNNEDVIFLLKNLNGFILEKETMERERDIQSGTHYCEMLPIESLPTKEYMDMFHSSLKKSSLKVATAVGAVSEKIISKKGMNLVLVSLARGGTPIGILIKRYIKFRYEIDIPHYSVSIIRGKGLDYNAIKYIYEKHPNLKIQFVDGWTGKGAIQMVLRDSCKELKENHNIKLDDLLAVLADPGRCTSLFGTREDFLIPSACLNSTVSGLISRTVLREDLIGKEDFHGAKYYEHLKNEDVSNFFVDTISKNFPHIEKQLKEEMKKEEEKIDWIGWKTIEKIQKQYNIQNINFIKPGATQ